MDQLSLLTSDRPGLDSGDGYSLLSQLIEDSKLYRTSEEYKALLVFVAEMKEFAPFNAMLLQIQKPGLTYAATSKEWMLRFSRTVKEGARPLLIMWPFSPVALVYDVQDTEGEEIPEAALHSFPAYGDIDQPEVESLANYLLSKNIEVLFVDMGDANAGSIRRFSSRQVKNRIENTFRLRVNKNHKAPVKLVTLLHELAHLFLGHITEDSKLKIAARLGLDHSQKEMEAESVAYIVSHRLGVDSRSESYLSSFVEEYDSIERLDIYKIMKAAGNVESLVRQGLERKRT